MERFHHAPFNLVRVCAGTRVSERRPVDLARGIAACNAQYCCEGQAYAIFTGSGGGSRAVNSKYTVSMPRTCDGARISRSGDRHSDDQLAGAPGRRALHCIIQDQDVAASSSSATLNIEY